MHLKFKHVSYFRGIKISTHICNYRLSNGNRQQKMYSLIACFLGKDYGNGKGSDAFRYKYNIEFYGNYGIFLKRPTQLNKGFDLL